MASLVAKVEKLVEEVGDSPAAGQFREGFRIAAPAVENCFVAVAEIFQRGLVLFVDVVLLCLAITALMKDWGKYCEESLHLYCIMCVFLCLLDLVWELARCSSESALDRLQASFRPAVAADGISDRGLLAGGTVADEEGMLGSPAAHQESQKTTPVGSAASMTTGTLGQGVMREKMARWRCTRVLHSGSLGFTILVSMVFSVLSGHDEVCMVRVPNLYTYVHLFAYVYIFRLGAFIVWGCCRTVKDYEDAARAAGAVAHAARNTKSAQELDSMS